MRNYNTSVASEDARHLTYRYYKSYIYGCSKFFTLLMQYAYKALHFVVYFMGKSLLRQALDPRVEYGWYVFGKKKDFCPFKLAKFS